VPGLDHAFIYRVQQMCARRKSQGLKNGPPQGRRSHKTCKAWAERVIRGNESTREREKSTKVILAQSNEEFNSLVSFHALIKTPMRPMIQRQKPVNQGHPIEPRPAVKIQPKWFSLQGP